MSGIAGVFWLDGRPADTSRVNVMLAAIGHRGTQPPRLATRASIVIGELADKLNLPIPARVDTMIVADARLDNATELAKLLAKWEPSEDQALLHHAYQRWGPDCAQRLLGDFAIAIWDERQQQLICMRDQFGARPLFYYFVPGHLFAFGSEVKALLTVAIAARIDETAIADYLAWHHDDERTFYEGIRRLPPGHTLTASRDGVAMHRYWAPDITRAVHYTSDIEYSDEFRALFTEAVRCRLETSANLGAELSGGLDSSAVACIARQLLPEARSLSTFSLVVTEDPRYDERAFIDAVTHTGRFKPEYFDITDQSPLRHMRRVAHIMDGPVPGAVLSDIWDVYAHASACGIDVMLDGCEGDLTVYHNFRYLADLARELHWSTLLHEARAINHLGFHGSASVLWVLGRYCVPFLLPPGLATPRMRRYVGMLELGDTQASLISKQFARSTGIFERLALARREVSQLRSHRESHAYELTHATVAKNMEATDHIGAAFTIARSHPFYDRRLVEFCLALPREQLVSKGWTRPVLRRAVRDVLPDKVYRRGDKVGIHAPRRLGRLEHRALEETAEDAEVLGEYVNMARLRKITTRYLDGDMRVGDHVLLWPALSLRYWLRRSES